MYQIHLFIDFIPASKSVFKSVSQIPLSRKTERKWGFHLTGAAPQWWRGRTNPPRSWVELLILTACGMCCRERQSRASVLTSTRGVTGLESGPALQPAERSRMVWTALRSAAVTVKHIKQKRKEKNGMFSDRHLFFFCCVKLLLHLLRGDFHSSVLHNERRSFLVQYLLCVHSQSCGD